MDVLLVEDDDTIAEPLARGLERQGFSVRRAADGAGALAEVDRQRPDIVLLDLGLPDIDGYEVCRRLRADSALPIIVVTARGDHDDGEGRVGAEAAAHLVAVDVGEAEIEQHDVRSLAIDLGECAGAVGGAPHGEPLSLEATGEGLGDGVVVLDQQHVHSQRFARLRGSMRR